MENEILEIMAYISVALAGFMVGLMVGIIWF